jgi:hypothetical protein
MGKRQGKDKVRATLIKCPLCEKIYDSGPSGTEYAISRYVGLLNICPDCGVREAMEGFWWKWNYRKIFYQR